MEEIHITYKESIFNHVLLIVLSLFIIPLAWWAYNSNDPIFYDSIIITKIIMGIMFFVFSLITFYCFYVILKNKNTNKELKVKDGKILFWPRPHSKLPISIDLKSIENPEIRKVRNAAVLALIFSVEKNKYVIPNTNFNEEQFSGICNAIVKHSFRCKACQSTQVSWSGVKGHCHNCETITPIDSDKFDWCKAYQA